MKKDKTTSLVEIKKLWNENKHSQWDCDGLGEICAADFIPGGWWFNHESETPPEDYLVSAEKHYQTILHWRGMLAKFKGDENNIPEEFAITYIGDYIEDGMHRLTAAYIEGLEFFPVLNFDSLNEFLQQS